MKQNKAGATYFVGKRIFDLISALLLLILISPLMLMLALLVVLTSRGPALFKDPRIGKNGKTIKVLKFRTMYSDAETHPERYLSASQMQEWKIERKVKSDPRIVPFGRFLRKTSLDELPQLFNIIVGNMSVVGPRAVTQKELDDYYSRDEKNLLLSIKPGLTGYWQAYGRSNVTYETGERVKMEMKYFEKRGWLFDLKIIFATIPAVLSHKGAQ
jgi:lipopolysaccharide/colanic/teichoic acid biosynthesis glycosyltransferase